MLDEIFDLYIIRKEDRNEKNYFWRGVMRQEYRFVLFIGLIAFLFFSNVFAGGGVYWQENGIQICSYGSNGPLNVFDGKKSVIIIWHDWRNIIDANTDIYGQRVYIDGNFLWEVDGVPVAITPDILGPPEGAISDGQGGALSAWADGRDWITTGGDIYAQRVDSLGNRLWGSAGTAVCVADSEQENLSMVSDGKSGAIIVWEDGRNGYFYNMDLYAQRIDSSGAIQWQYNGVPVCTAGEHQRMPDIIEDNKGGAIVVWRDTRTINPGVYCQRLDSLGTELWGPNGIGISTGSWTHGGGLLCSSGTAFIVLFGDKRSGNWGIYAQRIRNDGSIVWDSSGIPVCSDSAQIMQFDVVSDNQGGALIIWEDERNGNHDIYAQRIDSFGQVLWQENGVYVCTAADSAAESIFIRAVSDGRSGVILAWSPWDTPEEKNIYAQRVDSLGVCQWDSNGLAVCTAPNTQRVTGICIDGEGGAIISWMDNRITPGRVYAQRVGDVAGIQEKRDHIQKNEEQRLLLCFPNPFTTEVSVKCSGIGEKQKVTLGIYDVTGRLVKNIYKGMINGRRTVNWHGDNENGRSVSQGIYFLRLKNLETDETFSRKLIKLQ